MLEGLMTWLQKMRGPPVMTPGDRLRQAMDDQRDASMDALRAVDEWERERAMVTAALTRDGPARAIREAQRRLGEGR